MAEIVTNQRTFEIQLSEHEVCALFLALQGARMLAVTSPAYDLKGQLRTALGYEPSEDIY